MGRFQLSVDSQILRDRILEYKDKPGELIPYSDLSELIGRDVQGPARGLLKTARRLLQREYQVLLDVKPNEGLFVLSEGQKARTWRRSADKIRRETKRAVDRLVTVDHSKLNREELTEALTGQSFAGAIALASSPQRSKRIQQRVQETTKALPSSVTLGLMAE